MAASHRATELLVRRFFAHHPDEAARLLDTRPLDEIIELFRSDPPPEPAVLEALSPDVAASVLAALDDARARDLLLALDVTRAATLLARLDAAVRDRRLALVDTARARELRALMAHPPESAGSLMDPRATAFLPETTVEDAIGRLRALKRRGIVNVFLTDAEGRLRGTVALQDLAVAPPTERLATLAGDAPARIAATATRDEAVEAFERLRPGSLPVVDFDGRLLGVIRQDALLAAAQEAATADLQTMVGASKDERALSPVAFAVRKRLPWLEVNLGTAFLAAAVVGLFEDTIARFTALAVLLPVVAGQSGNTGAQALAVTMRGLALREVRVRDWPRVVLKEGNVAVFTGLAVALTTAGAVLVWSGSTGLALVICISMVLSMVAAGLAGATIPMVLTALGQDPAQSSSIVLTTVTDVVGFMSFLGIASLFANML
jgi:magnesium transporter